MTKGSKMDIKKYRIYHAYGSGAYVEFDHPEELENIQAVSGVYTKSGGGYCPKCAAFIIPDEIVSYETKYDAMIGCENCGIDTALNAEQSF